MYQIGDIVSFLDADDERLYYAQLRGFLMDQYCEKSAVVTWLVPTSASPQRAFDPATYILGEQSSDTVAEGHALSSFSSLHCPWGHAYSQIMALLPVSENPIMWRHRPSISTFMCLSGLPVRRPNLSAPSSVPRRWGGASKLSQIECCACI